MASIIPQKNKAGEIISYAVAVMYHDDSGKKKYKWYTFQSEKEAKLKKHEVEFNQDKGMFAVPGKLTLGQFLDTWLKQYCYPNLAPKTAENYEHMIKKHIGPGLGKIPLGQLKPSDIQKYYTDKTKDGGLSARTIRHHHTLLHGALSIAVKQGLIMRNLCDATTPPKFQQPEMQILDENGIHIVLEAAKHTQYYTLYYVELFTGMRRSEVLGLKWSDIDLDLCELSVNRSMHHLKDGSTVFRSPKTARSRRRIALTPSTALVLKEHKAQRETDKIMAGAVLSPDELVFCTPDGKPLLPDTITRCWIRMTRRLGLNIRLHDLRHTHASLMLKQGVHPAIVQQRLGHASITTTIDTYSHILPGLQAAAAKGFDELVNGKPEISQISSPAVSD